MVVHEPESHSEHAAHTQASIAPSAPTTTDSQPPVVVSTTSLRRPRPRRLLRYFLIQLLPVTAGILIALLIDGLIELRRQVVLVNEAHAALAIEIASNRVDLQGTIPSMNQLGESLFKAITYIDDMLTTGTTDITDISFSLSTPSLNQASWETAQRTGALGYMDYSAVRAYSELYALQELVVTSQNRMYERYADMGVLIHAMASDNPAARPQDLESSRALVLGWITTIGVHRELAQQLVTAYEEVPKKLAAVDKSSR